MVLNGLDLLADLRGGPHPCDAIVITAAKESDSVRAAVRLGVADYVRKPVQPERIAESLRRVLANRLVFALITGALLIGSSLLGAFDRGGPQVPLIGVPLVAFAGFSIALVLGGLLLVLILRDRRI